jgi:hypothetical protein
MVWGEESLGGHQVSEFSLATDFFPLQAAADF